MTKDKCWSTPSIAAILVVTKPSPLSSGRKRDTMFCWKSRSKAAAKSRRNAPAAWEFFSCLLLGRNWNPGSTAAVRKIQTPSAERAGGTPRKELAGVCGYDYAVVNEKVDETVQTIRTIIAAEKQRFSRMKETCDLLKGC